MVKKYIILSIMFFFLFSFIHGWDQDQFHSYCPYIYASNGDNFVLDAEPLAGAFRPELQRTDWRQLEYLKESGHRYELLLMNGSGAVHYIDELTLRVVDHPAHTRVIPDAGGNLFAFRDIRPPDTVTGDGGEDLSMFFLKQDEVCWSSCMKDVPFKHGSGWFKEQIFLNFSKPEGVSRCRLVYSARNTRQGARALTEYFKLLDAGSGGDILKMMRMITRDEIGSLKIRVRIKGEWVIGGTIPADPPRLSNTGYLDLDLCGVTGDAVRIKLTPFWGFWLIDFIGLEFSPPVPIRMHDVKPKRISKQKQQIPADSLHETDRTYLKLSEESGLCYVSFDARKRTKKMSRTVFLKSSGYYRMVPPEKLQIDRAKNIQLKPAYLVKQLLKFNMPLSSRRQPGCSDR